MSRKYYSKSVTELGQIRSVDRPVAVEVEERHVTGIASDGPEGVPERRQIQAVDRLVPVDVAEESVQGLRLVPARQTAGNPGTHDGQHVVTVDERRTGGRAFGERAGERQLGDRLRRGRAGEVDGQGHSS